ncbi:MAG TPA: hypothetical protein PKW28_15790, partial [Turneriella sp.]|nr:hypothetical protein [Turneriella sp.]
MDSQHETKAANADTSVNEIRKTYKIGKTPVLQLAPSLLEKRQMPMSNAHGKPTDANNKDGGFMVRRKLTTSLLLIAGALAGSLYAADAKPAAPDFGKQIAELATSAGTLKIAIDTLWTVVAGFLV